MLRSSMVSLAQFGLGGGGAGADEAGSAGGRLPYGGVEMARLVVRPWATSGPASPPVGTGRVVQYGGVNQAHLIRSSVGGSAIYTSFATSAMEESPTANRGGGAREAVVAASSSQVYSSFAGSAVVGGGELLLPGEDSGLMSGSVVYSSIGGLPPWKAGGNAARASVAASVQALGPIPPSRPKPPSTSQAADVHESESFGAPSPRNHPSMPPPPLPAEPPLDPAVVARNKAEAAANKLR